LTAKSMIIRNLSWTSANNNAFAILAFYDWHVMIGSTCLAIGRHVALIFVQKVPFHISAS
jgi:hypothetical protein